MDADFTYREVVTQSGAAAVVADEMGKMEELARVLDHLFASNPRMHLMFENKPRQLDAFCQIREENIEKGLPSIVLISMGKSASVAVGNIFHSGYGLPSFAYSFLNYAVIPSWARDYARGGACYVNHLLPHPENIRRLKEAGLNRIIVHVRDPRQALLSLMHHHQLYRAHYPDIAKNIFSRETLYSPSEKEMGLYYAYIQWIGAWLKASDELEIHFSDFRDFVQDPRAFIQGYVDFYGHESHFNLELALTENKSVDNHRRLGETDEWRRVFTAEQQSMLNALLPNEMMQYFNWKI